MNIDKIKEFPITQYLDEICGTLKKSSSRFLILTAETAAGKSTILPLALLEKFDGKIMMTEPRRLAVLGVANRVSELNNESCGKTVGYKIHLENKISDQTRLEVVTEAILIRQLQNDPLLENYNVVVLDEFHERSINTDLALAFLKEAMQVRDDLFVVIMSATIDTDKLQNYLGKETPVLQIPGRQFPVHIFYDSQSTVEKAIEREVNERLPKLSKSSSILVFLPSIKDIRKVQENLISQISKEVEIQILHSSISLEEQKKVLKSSDKPKLRVILSSSIAETSLTVPDVHCVIDSGFSRVNRINAATGMETLSTEVESEFSAKQRTGRAGRLCEGKCIRLWSEADPRIKEMPCEILRADLTSLVLECADRGMDDLSKIDWLEKPSQANWNSSVKLLQLLGMIDEKIHITQKGRESVNLGIHPRLAGIALETGDLDLIVKYSSYKQSATEIQRKFKKDLENRLKRANFCKKCVNFAKNEENFEENSEILTKNTKKNCAEVLLYGFPDRIARKISDPGKIPVEFQFENGRKALLYEDAGRAGEWIIAPQVMAGEREGTIFEYENIDFNKVTERLPNNFTTKIECSFEDGKIRKEEKYCFGQIILSSKYVPCDSSDYALAWCAEVTRKGIGVLPSDRRLEEFLSRAEFWFQENKNEKLDDYIVDKVNEWLPPFITGSKVDCDIIYNALYWFLEGNKIDIEVPSIFILPNGTKCKVHYEKLASPDDRNKLIIRPVIEVIIQRVFGCSDTPVICGMKVLMRLLSPANRPLQITDDLEHFWTGAWPEICKEMKGRYPKHNWDIGAK